MNAAVNAFFLIFKLLSLYFLAVSLFCLCRRKKPAASAGQRRFAILIAARNEESCIAGLIESLQAQRYPRELFDIWVLPNNCTDHTVEAAQRAGARIMEMPSSVRSKGAALQYAADTLLRGQQHYDAFCVFDADNEADPAFLAEMNQALSRAAIVKSRILAKNRMQAGISACYEIYFCTANRFLNRAREALGLSARVIGTGFSIRRDLLEALGGFPCCTLAEDAELYAACLSHGIRIGYCESAMFYDEQPTTFKQSWNQRMRWSKGFYQVMFRYGRELIAMMFKKREMFVSCYDMFMTLAPATLLSIGCILLNLIFLAYGATDVHMLRRILPGTLGSIAFAGVNFYLLMFSIGFITLVTEWNKILAPANKKIKSLFTFPLFMITYVPISLVALVKKVEWKPIAHSISKSVEEIELQQQANK